MTLDEIRPNVPFKLLKRDIEYPIYDLFYIKSYRKSDNRSEYAIYSCGDSMLAGYNNYDFETITDKFESDVGLTGIWLVTSTDKVLDYINTEDYMIAYIPENDYIMMMVHLFMLTYMHKGYQLVPDISPKHLEGYYFEMYRNLINYIKAIHEEYKLPDEDKRLEGIGLSGRNYKFIWNDDKFKKSVDK